MHATVTVRGVFAQARPSALRPCPTQRLFASESKRLRQAGALAHLTELGRCQIDFRACDLVSEHGPRGSGPCESFNLSRKVMNRTEPNLRGLLLCQVNGQGKSSWAACQWFEGVQSKELLLAQRTALSQSDYRPVVFCRHDPVCKYESLILHTTLSTPGACDRQSHRSPCTQELVPYAV
jgi:hypothetical protein